MEIMSKGLRTTFLVHVIVVLVFGVPLLLVPKTYEAITQWDPIEPAIARTLGAMLLSLGVSSWMGYKASSWSEVRIVVVQEIAFTLLGSLASLYQALGPGAPTMVWLNIAVMGIFCVFWIYFYTKAKPAGSMPPPVGL
jgi:hypothetical protein